MYLFKVLWVIEINYQTILSFILGIFIGFILLLLIYAILVLKSVRDVKLIKVNPTDTMTEQEAKALIEQAIIDFKDKTKRGKNSKGTHFRILVQDLVYGIAASFFPKSKYPLAEISVSEAILLLDYIQKRINEILDRKVLRMFKKFKISDIIGFSLSTKKVHDAKAFQVTKKMAKTTSVITKVLGVINPINLFRKYVVSNTLSKAVDKIYIISLSIVGEEAFKIYSKAVLKEPLEIESNVDEIYESMKDDFSESEIEANDEFAEKEKKEVKGKFRTNNLVLENKESNRLILLDQNQKFLELKKAEELEDVQEKEETN